MDPTGKRSVGGLTPLIQPMWTGWIQEPHNITDQQTDAALNPLPSGVSPYPPGMSLLHSPALRNKKPPDGIIHHPPNIYGKMHTTGVRNKQPPGGSIEHSPGGIVGHPTGGIIVRAPWEMYAPPGQGHEPIHTNIPKSHDDEMHAHNHASMEHVSMKVESETVQVKVEQFGNEYPAENMCDQRECETDQDYGVNQVQSGNESEQVEAVMLIKQECESDEDTIIMDDDDDDDDDGSPSCNSDVISNSECQINSTKLTLENGPDDVTGGMAQTLNSLPSENVKQTNNGLQAIDAINAPAAAKVMDIFVCHIYWCRKAFQTKETYDTHLKGHEDLTPDTTCKYCGQTFVCNFNLRRHVMKHEGEKPFSCEICGMNFCRKYELTVHSRKEHGQKVYKCTICMELFCLLREARRHVIRHRPDIRDLGITIRNYEDSVNPADEWIRFRCSECEDWLQDEEAVAAHLKTHDTVKEPILKCRVCHRLFSKPENLERHMLRHGVQGKQKCLKCGELFSDGILLDSHLSKVHSIKQYKCYRCDKDFGLYSSARVHVSKHTRKDQSENTLKTPPGLMVQRKCLDCDDWFPDRATLLQHRRMFHESLKLVSVPVKRTRKNRRGNKSVCKVCKKVFFWKVALQLHSYSHQINHEKKMCLICEKVFPSARAAQKHVRIHDGGQRLDVKCEFCDKMFVTKHTLKKHVRRVHENSPYPFNCEICGVNFNRQHTYIAHKKIHEPTEHGAKTKKAIETPKPEASTEFKKKWWECPVCKRIMQRSSRKMHMQKTHFRADKCEYCVKIYQSDEEKIAHEKIHIGRREYLCNICSKVLSSADGYRRHRNLHSEKYKCETCNRKFRSLHSLREHCISKHSEGTDGEIFTCETCSKEFRSKLQLQHHIRNHEERTHMCQVCKISFSFEEQLTAHMKIHEEDRKFKCKICGLGFDIPKSFRNHMRTHNGIKPYRCMFCNKDFFSPTPLNIHVRSLHLGERPHKCDSCEQGFSTSSSLRRHKKRIHKQMDQYKCDFCHQWFPTRASQFAHQKSHPTDEQIYRCYMCGKTYRNGEKYRKHINQNHDSDGNAKMYPCEICGRELSSPNSLNNHMKLHTMDKNIRCMFCYKCYPYERALKDHIRKAHKVKYRELRDSGKSIAEVVEECIADQKEAEENRCEMPDSLSEKTGSDSKVDNEVDPIVIDVMMKKERKGKCRSKKGKTVEEGIGSKAEVDGNNIPKKKDKGQARNKKELKVSSNVFGKLQADVSGSEEHQSHPEDCQFENVEENQFEGDRSDCVPLIKQEPGCETQIDNANVSYYDNSYQSEDRFVRQTGEFQPDRMQDSSQDSVEDSDNIDPSRVKEESESLTDYGYIDEGGEYGVDEYDPEYDMDGVRIKTEPQC